jgi:hypothetical protein
VSHNRSPQIFLSLAKGEEDELIAGGCPQTPPEGVTPSGLPRYLTAETGSARKRARGIVEKVYQQHTRHLGSNTSPKDITK